MKKTYTHRFLARIVLEATTPLKIGNGDKSFLTDAVVATDVNGLPYIPGSAIAGVVRHSLPKEDGNALFGYQKKEKGHGSNIIFSEAKMLGKDGKPIDGLQSDLDFTDDYLSHFAFLPIRQHVRINHQGSTDKGGKFDEQVVFKGTRFLFEMELVGRAEDEKPLFQMIRKMQSPLFRLGGGTRHGFGEMKVVSVVTKKIDLCNEADKSFYLNKSSNLASEWDGVIYNDETAESAGLCYQMELIPDDFILFASGHGDEDADMTPVEEEVLEWDNNGKPHFVKHKLIPASSIKGALSHRVAYHYNKQNEVFAKPGESLPDAAADSNNEAVRTLFGYAGTSEKENLRGNVIFSDLLFCSSLLKEKTMPHVAIDQFTGGTMNGALFQEKVLYARNGMTLTFVINVAPDALKDDKIKDAWEMALTDVCKGLLPLGGGVNRGNGCFHGSLTRNGETIWPK